MVEVTGFGRATPFTPPAAREESYTKKPFSGEPSGKAGSHPVASTQHKKRTRSMNRIPSKYGRGDWIRTSGLYVPNVALYQAEPHLEKWLRKKDSNPHVQSQSLLCYLYTIPQYLCCNDCNSKIYYTKPCGFVNPFCCFSGEKHVSPFRDAVFDGIL